MANLYSDESPGGYSLAERRRQHFYRRNGPVYGWIALRLTATGAVAWLSYQIGILDDIRKGSSGAIGYLAAVGIQLAAIFGISAVADRVAPAVAGRLYLAFTAVSGLTISCVIWPCVGDTIIPAFALPPGVFAAMCVIGYAAKRDISGPWTMCGSGWTGRSLPC